MSLIPEEFVSGDLILYLAPKGYPLGTWENYRYKMVGDELQYFDDDYSYWKASRETLISLELYSYLEDVTYYSKVEDYLERSTEKL